MAGLLLEAAATHGSSSDQGCRLVLVVPNGDADEVQFDNWSVRPGFPFDDAAAGASSVVLDLTRLKDSSVFYEEEEIGGSKLLILTLDEYSFPLPGHYSREE